MKRRSSCEDGGSELQGNKSAWRVMDCMVGWKKRLHKVNKRKLYVYTRNVHSTLNFAVCEGTFRPNDPNAAVDLHSVRDNIAFENGIKLVAYKNMETDTSSSSSPSTSSRRFNTLSSSTSSTSSTTTLLSTSTLTTANRNNTQNMSRDFTRGDVSRFDDVTSKSSRTRSESSCVSCASERRKPIKRIYSHSDEYGHIYKKINWQDWTMNDTNQQKQTNRNYKRKNFFSKQRRVVEEEEGEDGVQREGKENCRPSPPFLSTHREISFHRLSRLYFDYDLDSEEDERGKNNVPPYFTQQENNQSPGSPRTDYYHPKHHHNPSFTGSMKSVHGSNRGSVQSNNGSIRSSSAGSPVPMNFIPGQLKPMTSKEKLSKVPLFGDIQKVIFCFKGITCRVEKSQPRTAKAIVHTGMMFLSMSAPSAHKCPY